MIQDTSLNAYSNIQAELGKRQRAVYEIIKYLHSPTNLEISKWAGIPINQITPRTNELRKKGLLKEDGKRFCHVSGKMANTWRVA